jgi:preprotein translocase subunit SecF
MWAIKNRIYFYILSAALMLTAAGSLAMNKWNFSIEFTGGALMEVHYKEVPTIDVVNEALVKAGFEGARAQTSGDKGIIVRTKALEITDADREALAKALDLGKGAEVVRYNSFGPSIGDELKHRSLWAIMAVIFAIVCYIAYAFREVSRGIPSWAFGAVVVAALVHDVVIPAGVYIWLGAHDVNAQIDVLFVTAILTVLGYSVHDSIVVFDRTRENLKEHPRTSFDQNVGNAMMQTMGRSINTSLTVFITAVALWIFGGESTKYFSMVLALGVLVGTYSSVFIGSPLLVTVADYLAKKEKAEK